MIESENTMTDGGGKVLEGTGLVKEFVQGGVTLEVLRGASFVTRGRLRHEKARGAATPGVDEGFCGFRSCAF